MKSATVSINREHTATAKVGRDIIEDAEYLVFDHSWWPERNKPETFKGKLEDLWYDITLPFHRFKNRIRDIYWEIRYGFQRMFKGYDSVDCFETFAKFIERYTRILTEYKKHHVGYPGTMSEEEWENIIDDMLYHLYYMDEYHIIEELEKDVPEDWNASYKTITPILDKHKNEFFKLFSEYFYNLWD